MAEAGRNREGERKKRGEFKRVARRCQTTGTRLKGISIVGD